MTSIGTLKPLERRKLHFACSLKTPQTPTYDIRFMLALKTFICTLVLAFKSPNTVFVASFDFLSFNTA